MTNLSSNWKRLQSLARRARLAGSRHQSLELHLSPEESLLLADILDGVLQLASAVIGEGTPSFEEPDANALTYDAAEAGDADRPPEEPELYNESDREARFPARNAD